MTEFKFSIPENIAEKMEGYPDVNWNEIAKNAIENYLKNLELAWNKQVVNELSTLSEKSLNKFLENELDLYTDDDLVKKYK